MNKKIPCPWINICGVSVNLDDKFAKDKLADHIADHVFMDSKNQRTAEILAKTIIELQELKNKNELENWIRD